jgi:peptide/nickel transport system permease protein
MRRWRVARYIAGRLAQGAVVLFGALLISFLLTTLSGNSAALQGGGTLTPDQIAALSHAEGYDKPVLDRFWHYLTGVVHGDFGRSYRYGGSAVHVVLSAFPYTLMLVAGALAVSLAVAVPTAVYAVIRRNTVWDRVFRRTLLLGQGVPEFWLALLLVLIFAVTLGWLPSIGYSGVSSAILPVLALSVPLVPAVVRLLQGQLLDVMAADFIAAERAKGLSESAIVLRHGLRNALPGFTTYLALQIGWLVAGTVIVESVFQWPGIGSAMLSAVQNRDVTVIQAVVMLVAVFYVVLNLAADFIVLALDPRIRTEER